MIEGRGAWNRGKRIALRRRACRGQEHKMKRRTASRTAVRNLGTRFPGSQGDGIAKEWKHFTNSGACDSHPTWPILYVDSKSHECLITSVSCGSNKDEELAFTLTLATRQSIENVWASRMASTLKRNRHV
ncbi:hypothetical protein GOP47_0024507 [Adiantum capillus-veneris]|uniref:Uncharacterized protein n=1 Tax=Adiantum capillus-veneris TaxID=13818 RepID=A0A9D4U2T4_ADICA|nr:hypothetical protein GOP47_0024507 [Adiantum capillus-veneris]